MRHFQRREHTACPWRGARAIALVWRRACSATVRRCRIEPRAAQKEVSRAVARRLLGLSRMASAVRRNGPDVQAPQQITLDAADLAALLEVVEARDPAQLERSAARLRALLGSSATRLEPHLRALYARLRELQLTRRLAATDALTGLANRRSFSEAFRRELARCTRSGTPLAVVMLDLDDFKSINDTWGHSAGDDVLRLVARHAQQCVRQGDLVARLGGDELALLLPDTDPHEARAIGGRIRDSVAPTSTDSAVRAGPAIGVSLGVAVAPRAASVQQVLAEADRDLYRDKAARKSMRAPSANRSPTAA